MTYKKEYVEKILLKDYLSLTYFGLILNLLKKGKLNHFIKKIPEVRTKIICPRLYKKKYLNGCELFLINLDFFINYMNRKTLLPYIYNEKFLSHCLRSKYAEILITSKYIHDDTETLKEFIEQCDKIIADAFSKQMKQIFFKINDKLRTFNISYETFKLNEKSQTMLIVELFKGIVITNYEQLINILPKMFVDINLLKRKYSDIDTAISIYEQAWEYALNNLSANYLAMKKIYDFNEL